MERTGIFEKMSGKIKEIKEIKKTKEYLVQTIVTSRKTHGILEGTEIFCHRKTSRKGQDN